MCSCSIFLMMKDVYKGIKEYNSVSEYFFIDIMTDQELMLHPDASAGRSEFVFVFLVWAVVWLKLYGCMAPILLAVLVALLMLARGCKPVGERIEKGIRGYRWRVTSTSTVPSTTHSERNFWLSLCRKCLLAKNCIIIFKDHLDQFFNGYEYSWRGT